MNILYIEPDFAPGQSYAYYYNMANAIAKKTNMRILPGRGYNISIDEIKNSFPEIDLICFGYGWMNIWKNGVHYKETIIEGIEKTDIPIAVFLNKEYGGALASKLGWIKELKPDFAFTYHHDYELFGKLTGVPFHYVPFAADPDIFKDYGHVGEKYDIGFTGGLGHTHTNGWETNSEFGKLPTIPADGQGWSHDLRRQVKEAHGSWDGINFYFSNHHHDDLTTYAKRLNSAKIWLSTTGPVDIVGTRYFEVMLSNTTLLACNRSDKMWCFDEDCNRKDRNVDVYGELFERDKHYIDFSTPGELREKILYYRDNETARQEIVRNAHEHVKEFHTWDNRADKFLEIIRGR